MTSAPRELVELQLQVVAFLCQKLVAAEAVTRGKPDPESFLKAAKLLSVPMNDCLVFEDFHPGVGTAKAAGAHVAFVGHVLPADKGMLAIANSR